jgi:hypothetical protein
MLRPGFSYKNQVLWVVQRGRDRERERERDLYVLKVDNSEERDRSQREDRFYF